MTKPCTAPAGGRSQVTKHRAPKGALRPIREAQIYDSLYLRQKAPSAKRCIKTGASSTGVSLGPSVRKHRAPKGALRLIDVARHEPPLVPVRKRRAPKGALRLRGAFLSGLKLIVRKHRAPKGALRLGRDVTLDRHGVHVRKHRAPKGALRRNDCQH